MSLWPAQARSTAVEAPRFPGPLGLWMGVNALDMLLTFYLLGVGGTEGNPMLGFALASGGAGSMLAVKLGLARALKIDHPDFEPALRAANLLTRDARKVERKKYGLRKARRATQFSKR